MRATIKVDGRNRVCDTEKSTEVAGSHVTFGEYGDPDGYEETTYETRTGVRFIYGVGGPESPYPEPTIKPEFDDED